MTTFCLEHDISRKTFYVLRARARRQGQAAVLEPRSRRPATSPTRIDEDTKQRALDVRAALEASGLDHGPVSVHDKLVAMGLTSPSTASLARIFRDKGVARVEPKKRPRAAYRRFVYPAPNACWQLDATEYVLTGGRKCVIFQLEDDHSRLAVASHVAAAETSDAAIAVVEKGIAARGVPQRLLTDNGVALNPSRRGWQGRLVEYVTSLGVEAITGKPYKPTTQGKNERFHQTLFRFLDKQPIASSLPELQAQVDVFDRIYNTERGHQGLPGRITPQRAWDATAVAEPPKPKVSYIEPLLPDPRGIAGQGAIAASIGETPPPTEPPLARRAVAARGSRLLVIRPTGSAKIRGIEFQISSRLAGQSVLATWDETTVGFVDQHGETLAC
ncbi:DDE-type integrase/transposase/recombinase [Pseudactinotalea sp. HY158]|uniref:integrase core domain-containing protein n=1 Tax=Pseudactinotalea sp. HY158 TaxID=2654547 RepID=UPI001E557FE1|nr:DDE-type integrase/transposase/recombinase [Pseudactinotalea sp. HY158]